MLCWPERCFRKIYILYLEIIMAGNPRNKTSHNVKLHVHETVAPREDDEEEFSALAVRVDHAPITALEWKDYYWEVVERGDCFCRRAVLRLYSDGLASFQAYTSTTSSEDVWLFTGLALENIHGGELYRISQFNGPRMDLTNHDYFVLRDRQTSPLIFPSQIYAHIYGVRMYAHC
jgi:hypothetical protein